MLIAPIVNPWVMCVPALGKTVPELSHIQISSAAKLSQTVISISN